jgi:phosphatidylcholine synthase
LAPKVEARIARLCAWGVHLYTALGLVLAAGIAVLLVYGGPDAFRWSFILMFAATLVDATDGTLARRARVKEILPGFDGRRLDDLIDFLTYTFLPLLLIWRAGLLPDAWQAWLLLPLLASAYGFCQVHAKTDDGYFLGFPSLWNVTAFYLYVLRLPYGLALGFLAAFALLTFVPSRYLYPSQPGRLNVVSNVLGALWAGMLVAVLWLLPADRPPAAGDSAWWIALASLFYPAFYMIASWAITVRRWRRSRRPLTSSDAAP